MTEAQSAPAFELSNITPSVVVIRFINSAERNPLSTSTLISLNASLSEVLGRPDVEAIIFTGVDDVFLSGANIRELAQLDTTSAKEFALFGQRIFQSIANARQRTIAAINGYCMGGGLDLALACDIRVASVNAKFAHPGARLGIITGWGGTQRLPRLIGKARAIEFFATARRLSADDAFSFGLVHALADPVMHHVLQIALSSNAAGNRRD
jgi:enoyl-CoA hydratase